MNIYKRYDNNPELLRKDILKDRKSVAKQIAKDMVDDFIRWEKEDPSDKSHFVSKGKKLSKSQMQQHLEKEVNKKLETIGRGYNTGKWNLYIHPDGSGDAHFTIDGLKEYSDAQPLEFDYDMIKKKVKNWGYV